ncbi:MAG: GDP-mannose 4,6-dehydratase [Cyclobacteriaceae bacterium]|nr:GDP-mannose 4,6-dehydratase [Cyclobacteriaceae bacterium]
MTNATDNNKKVLITGAAGFIGFHISRKLCALGYSVTGIDTLNDYYDVQLKLDRLAQLRTSPGFRFYTISITDKDSIDDLFEKNRFNMVLNLAAQAGVSV